MIFYIFLRDNSLVGYVEKDGVNYYWVHQGRVHSMLAINEQNWLNTEHRPLTGIEEAIYINDINKIKSEYEKNCQSA